ncbi:MAG: ATP-binding cassette domain-containing protein [Planktomarina sp.]
MERFDTTQVDDAEHVTPQDPIDIDPVSLADRGIPTWAGYLALFFALGTAVCVVGLAIVLVVFQSVVAIGQDSFAAGAILAVGVVPVLGLIVLDYAQGKSLAGLQGVRGRAVASAQAFVALGITIALTFIHPALALPSIMACGVSYGVLVLARRFSIPEKAWDFSPAEAVSILSGRDEAGLALAAKSDSVVPALSALSRLPVPLTFILSAGLSTWLVAQQIMVLPAVAAVVCVTVWCSYVIGTWLGSWQPKKQTTLDRAASVVEVLVPEDIADTQSPNGLLVYGLTVTADNATRLLTDVSFSIGAGEFIGVVGDASAGKSTLLTALANPFDLDGATVHGAVKLHDHSLWSRNTADQSVRVAKIDATNRLLPASGRDNLIAFQPDAFLDRGCRSLMSLIYSEDRLNSIVTAPDATRLGLSDQRALEMARAFFLAPQLFLLDRPEAATTQNLMTAFVNRLKLEKRAGRSALIVTEDRNLLALCDKMIVLQDGRMIDFGPASEIRDRATSGWARFVCDRQLESEDILDHWIRSHYRRNGDEANKRAACVLAAELLAFSCADTAALDDEKIHFEFKHFEGHSVLRVTDHGTLVSSGQMQIAQKDALEGHVAVSPLARLMHGAVRVEQALADGKRIVTLHLENVDPRKVEKRKAEKAAKPDRSDKKAKAKNKPAAEAKTD